MKYNIRTATPYIVIELIGEVDLNYSPEAREQILKHLNTPSDVLIDLSQVSYIDSSGVASLVEGFQLAKTNKQKFGLVGVSIAAMQVLELARLDKIFTIHSSVEECINNVS